MTDIKADKKTQFAEGVVYDLLSRGNLMDQTRMLQSSLEKLGYKIGSDRGRMGLETEGAVIGFLSHGRENFASRVNLVFAEEAGHQLTTFQNQHPGKAEDLSKKTIDSYLTQRTPLTKDEMTDLQNKLDKTGYKLNSNANGNLGMNTTHEIIDYLKDHPKLFGDISPSLLRQLAERNDIKEQPKYNSQQYLAATCRQSPEYMQLTRELVNDFNGKYSYGASIYNLQIALKAGGFYKGIIDGETGPGTNSAIENFHKFEAGQTKLGAAWDNKDALPSTDRAVAEYQPPAPPRPDIV